MVWPLCSVTEPSPLQDFVKSPTRLKPGLAASYFADLCRSKIGRKGQVSCETLISNQRFKTHNICPRFTDPNLTGHPESQIWMTRRL